MSEIKTVTFNEFMEMEEENPYVLVDENTVHYRKLQDFLRRNDNVRSGNPLCEHCDSTGNEFFNMYRQCPICNGDGVRKDDGDE